MGWTKFLLRREGAAPRAPRAAPRALAAVAFVSAVLGPAACSSEESNDIVLSGESRVLPGFNHDTGPVPASGPVQLAIRARGGGAGTRAQARLVVNEGRMDAETAKGNLVVDEFIGLDANVSVKALGKTYAGPVPGVSDLKIELKGGGTFSSLLLEPSAPAAVTTVVVPPRDFGEVPLGAAPGTLALSVVPGSEVRLSARGICLSASNGQAEYILRLAVSGTIVLRAEVRPSLPAPLNTPIGSEVRVPLPEDQIEVKLTGAGAVQDQRVGACDSLASNGGDAGTPEADSSFGGDSGLRQDAGGGPDGGGDRTCRPDSAGPSLTGAGKLPAVADCTGLRQGPSADVNDVPDYFSYVGLDDFCFAQPELELRTRGIEFCVFPTCSAGGAPIVSCEQGTVPASDIAGDGSTIRGCCRTTPGTLRPSTECPGNDDGMVVYARFRSLAKVCTAYSFSYGF